MRSAEVRGAVLRAVDEPIEIQTFDGVTPDPGGIVVDVDYAGVCGTDVHLHRGRLPVPTPLILGHEAVGRVAELGEGVTSDARGVELRVGDQVAWASSIPCHACFHCTTEKEFTLCENRTVYGINQSSAQAPYLSGGWAEQMYLRPGSTVLRLPEGVTQLDVISLGCAGPTVAHALLRRLPTRVGDCVVVQGCGPVGIAAAMYARLAGAALVVMVGAPRSRLESATAMGVCDVTIDIDEHPDPAERRELVLAHTAGGRGADLVVEATGHPAAVAEGIDLCRRNARYLVLGQYTDHGSTPINPHLITRKQLQVAGSWAFAGEDFIAHMATMPQLVERFAPAQMVTEYPLAEVNRALRDMAAGGVLKAALLPQP